MKPARLDQQEPSQRCRTFLFVAAGIAAALAKGAERVLMFESGSGAINVPFMAGMASGRPPTSTNTTFSRPTHRVPLPRRSLGISRRC